MRFNSTTLYPALYISEDETTISNRQSEFTHRVTSGPTHLHRYTGVLLNKPLSVIQVMYIEVMVSYRALGGEGILFEIGFEEREEIDKLLYLRENWGTIYVRVLTCSNGQGVCISASDGKAVFDSYKLSDNSVDKWFDLRLGFHINPDDDSIKIVYSLDNEKAPKDTVYKFLNADINDNKWPVFASYNPHMFQVHMKLNNVKNMWFDSSTIHPMVYISENKLELSNVPTKTTSRLSFQKGQFQKYEGVVANQSFDIQSASANKWPMQIYFDVLVEYNVTQYLTDNICLFEIGLSRYKYIDKHWTVGLQRYAVTVFSKPSNKENEVRLIAVKDGVHTKIGTLSNSGIGVKFRGIVRISINFERSTVTVAVDSHSQVFHNVDLTEPLWPVFALYKHGVDSMMTLK